MRLYLLLEGALSVLLWSHFTEARPQNPMEQMGSVAIAVASQAGSVMENGGAVRQEKGVETEFFKVHSKTEAGVGNAIRPPSYDDDDDERRRRKRWTQLEPDHPHQHRGKRSPCHYTQGGGGGGGGGGADQVNDFEEVARRMRAAKRKAARKAKKGKKAKKSKYSRRRRQADDPEAEAASMGQKISEQGKKIAAKIEETWKSMVQGFEKLGEQIKGAFEKAKEQQMPQDAQLLE